MSAMSLMFVSSLGNLFFGSIWLFQVRFYRELELSSGCLPSAFSHLTKSEEENLLMHALSWVMPFKPGDFIGHSLCLRGKTWLAAQENRLYSVQTCEPKV